MDPSNKPGFSRRIRLYIFGFLIGLAIVMVFFKDELTGDSTREKVRKEFHQDELSIGSKVEVKLDSLGIDTKQFRTKLDSGEFILQDLKGGGEQEKKFWIRIKDNGETQYRVELHVRDSITTEAVEMERWRD